MCGGLQKGTNVETMEAYFLGSFGGAECMCNHSSCTANLLSFHVPVHGNTSQANGYESIEHKRNVFSFSMWKVYDDCLSASATSLLGVYCNCRDYVKRSDTIMNDMQQRME